MIRNLAPVPVAVVALVVALLAVSSNAGPSLVSHAGDRDGVTPTSIRVGALGTFSGPFSASFAPVVQGVRAYFDRVNAGGGIDGRRIDYGPIVDDGTSPNGDLSGAQRLVASRVFAVVGVATPFFTGGPTLASHSVPTFGLQENTNDQWAGPSMYGFGGSYDDFSSPMPQVAYVAQKTGVRRAAVLAYNIAQSQQGCVSVIGGLRRYGIPIPVIDTSIPLGTATLDADVSRMRAAGVNFVASCMDVTGNIKLSQTLAQHGMERVTQYWLDGYDEATLRNNAAAMQGVYLLLQQTPFAMAHLEPGRYPGIDQFERDLARYEPGTLPSVPALAGWVSADLFVEGLKLVGRNLTRTGLVTALNALRAFTGQGAIAPVDWTSAHTGVTSLDCSAFVRVERGRFVPVFGSGRSVYVCFTREVGAGDRVVTVPPPKGVPGT